VRRTGSPWPTACRPAEYCRHDQADGRQTRTTYPDQSFSLTGYDALGRMTSKTDQASVVTGYGYDNLGRLTSVTQDVGGLNLVTNYGYDELGNRVAQTDAAKRTTKYAYDQLGRRSQRTLPLGQAESYGYEANGNLSSKTDFNGKTTTYSYDPTNRLLTKTPDASFNASPVTLTYTATGKRQTMTDPSGTTTYSYDPQTDRLMSKQTPYGTISYTYDAAGDVTDISSSNQNGAAMAYQYDKLNRLSSVIVAGGLLSRARSAARQVCSHPMCAAVTASPGVLRYSAVSWSMADWISPYLAPWNVLQNTWSAARAAAVRVVEATLIGANATAIRGHQADCANKQKSDYQSSQPLQLGLRVAARCHSPPRFVSAGTRRECHDQQQPCPRRFRRALRRSARNLTVR